VSERNLSELFARSTDCTRRLVGGPLIRHPSSGLRWSRRRDLLRDEHRSLAQVSTAIIVPTPQFALHREEARWQSAGCDIGV